MSTDSYSNDDAPVEETPVSPSSATPNTTVAPTITASEDAVPVSEADVTPAAPQVVSQEASIVGDENLPEPREPQADVRKDEVDAQVAQPREPDAAKVSVHEVVVVTDEVITDPSSPLAVQVPDAGRGSLDLPIHALAGETVEAVFAREASNADES
jgi:hypothetical protein